MQHNAPNIPRVQYNVANGHARCDTRCAAGLLTSATHTTAYTGYVYNTRSTVPT